MQPIRSNETDATAIAEACQKVANWNPDDFAEIKGSDFTINFSAGVPVIRRLVSIFAGIERPDIEALTTANRQLLSNRLRVVHKIFSEIEQPNQRFDSQQMSDRLRQTYEETRNNLVNIIAFIRPETTDQMQSILEDAQRKAREMDSWRDEAERVLAGIRDASAKAGVPKHARRFETAAERFGGSKIRWLRAAIALAGLTMFVGWWLLVWQQPDTTQLAETVPFILARVFVLGVLSYALVWSGKMFRAATHNQIVNEHRRDALETFETFVNGTSVPYHKSLRSR